MLEICLKMFSVLAEGQEKDTYGLGCKVTLTRNKDESV